MPSLKSKIFGFLQMFAALITLNVCWILTCLPVVTVGAAACALYKQVTRLRETGTVRLRDYFSDWKAWFVPSLVPWLCTLLAGAFLFIDVRLSILWQFKGHLILFTLFAILTVLYLFLTPYLFPVLVVRGARLPETVRTAFLLSIRFWRYSYLLLLLNLIPFVIWMINPYLFIYFLFAWLLFWGASVAYIGAGFINKAFAAVGFNKCNPADSEVTHEYSRDF